MSTELVRRVAEVFRAELEQAHYDEQPSAFCHWLEDLCRRVIEVVRAES